MTGHNMLNLGKKFFFFGRSVLQTIFDKLIRISKIQQRYEFDDADDNALDPDHNALDPDHDAMTMRYM